jgi:hypothetical protein
VISGIQRISSALLVPGALCLAACAEDVGHEVALQPIDLPDEVFEGQAPRGREIAFVRHGRLFVLTRDERIVFTLEPANGDTPPLVMAVAREFAADEAQRPGHMTALATPRKAVYDAD